MFSVFQVLAKKNKESDGTGWFIGNFLEDSPQKALEKGFEKIKNSKKLQKILEDEKVEMLYVKYYPHVKEYYQVQIA